MFIHCIEYSHTELGAVNFALTAIHWLAMPFSLQAAGVASVDELAAMAGVRDCLQWFTRQRQWINDHHLRLVRIPAPTFFEQERAACMASLLRELGCAVRVDDAGNVIALPKRMPEESFIVVSAHLDTVLAPRKPEDITVLPDGRFQGPGVSDNGAGLAALLALAGALEASPGLPGLHSGLVLLANVCEEGEGNLNGMKFFCDHAPEAARARAFVVLDGPAIDHVTCIGVESRRYEIVLAGPGGHGWSDFGTANPVHALARIIKTFLDDQPGTLPAGPTRFSFNFAVVEGGSSINSIPASARAKVDLRSESSSVVEILSNLLASSVDRGVAEENRLARAGTLSSQLRLIGARPGGRLSDDSSLLGYLRAVEAYLGLRSHVDSASTDANVPLARGIPAVCIGAGGSGGGAHSPSEWFHPQGRDLGLKRLFLTLCLLLRHRAHSEAST